MKRLLWQLSLPFFTLIAIAFFVFTWYAVHTFVDFHQKQLENDLYDRAQYVAEIVSLHIALDDTIGARRSAEALGKKTQTRITIIRLDGVVLGDSMENPAAMENHANRPEVRDALKHTRGTSIRFSHTLQREMMYRAIPFSVHGRIAGVVRTSLKVLSIQEAIHSMRTSLVMAGILLALLVALVSLLLSRRITNQITAMKAGAEQFSKGDFGFRLPVSRTVEIGGLADALNLMAQQLDERIRFITTQNTEQQAVLSSMVEGVIAMDVGCRIININDAAARLLGSSVESARGKLITEVTRNDELVAFASRSLDSSEPIEGIITIAGVEETYLQAHGTVLRNAVGTSIGAVIVLNDVTRLRHLENVRKDFVANVSHELKTPITSIKGFVETLLDGALENETDAKRFLGIIAKQADRLQEIIDDLLSLSRIEQETERDAIITEAACISKPIRSAIQFCDVLALEKNMHIILQCDETIVASINVQLIEQALVNLISNAIKYSESGSDVIVTSKADENEVVISVKDYGCGIDQVHLPRLFERFYRVDKARSRKLGGTGLGLAIVKHIAQAHGGRVCVESKVLVGSTFQIVLPKK